MSKSKVEKMWKMQINLDSQNLLTFGSFFTPKNMQYIMSKKHQLWQGMGASKGEK